MGGCFVLGCKSRTERENVRTYAIPGLRNKALLASRAKYERRRALRLSRIGQLQLLYKETNKNVCRLHFVSGKPSGAMDTENSDWAPSLLMGPDFKAAADPVLANAELASVCDQEPFVDQQPVCDQELVFEQEPFVDQQRVSDQELVCDQEPVCDKEPVYDKDLDSTVMEDDALEENWPISDVSANDSLSSSFAVSQDRGNFSSLSEKDMAFQELQSEYSQLLQSYAKLRDRLTESEVDKLELNQSLSELEANCEDYRRKSEILEAKTSDYAGEVKAKDDSNKELEKQLMGSVERIDILERQLVKLKSCVLTLDRLKNDRHFIKFYTGLNCYRFFEIILNHVNSHVSDTSRAVEPWQSLLLTLMRLRLSLSLQDLAYRFNISLSTACRTFEKWLYWLHKYLSPLINWPDRETLRLTMPHSFRDAFGDTLAVIIDCFELFTERPRALDSRAMTSSNCKHHNTLKYLIDITPLGAISFLSLGWGGRVSDKHITANSGLYQKLLPGDVILADRGFPIGEDVGSYCAKILVPAFTGGQAQLSLHDISDTRKLASLRVHVERVIGLVKSKYRILKNVLPSDFLNKKEGHTISQIDQIVHVCCALTNLSYGIVSDLA